MKKKGKEKKEKGKWKVKKRKRRENKSKWKEKKLDRKSFYYQLSSNFSIVSLIELTFLLLLLQCTSPLYHIVRRLNWQKRALKMFDLKTGVRKIRGKNCFTALLQTKAKFCKTFINFFCSFCEHWRYKELKVEQGLNLLQIATRVFLPTYIKIHQGWQYDQP